MKPVRPTDTPAANGRFGDDIWIMTVDMVLTVGSTNRNTTNGHKTDNILLPQICKSWDQLHYELGISISTSRLIWMNRPFKAGQNDGKIFRDFGLRDKLSSIQKKAIGERGYTGYSNEVR